jgi:hypothetical protein
MAKALGRDVAAPLDLAGFTQWLQKEATHAQPPIVLAFSLNLPLEPGAIELGRAQILLRIVQRERARPSTEFSSHGLRPEGVILLKALAASRVASRPSRWTFWRHTSPTLA